MLILIAGDANIVLTKRRRHEKLSEDGKLTRRLIPKLMLEDIGVAAGDAVELKINKKGRLVIAPLANAPRSGWQDECKTLAGAGEFGLVRDGRNPSGRDW